MFDLEKGIVKEIIEESSDKTIVLVQVNGTEGLAVNYNRLTGRINTNDEVLLNTTAVNLNLGTGGYHFVTFNLNNKEIRSEGSGHIMKLRYTPYQIKVLTAEEQDSNYHDAFNNFKSLNKMPVIVGTLHSMLMPIVSTLKYLSPKIKIAYIMTDGASLPVWFSNTVSLLKKLELIETTITIGHAFGGDIETVNVYNGLIAAKEIANCDIAVITMGPGIVGTGTKYGFTGIEQGYILDAVNTLGGCAIGIPRIGFSDKRERHRGISHHSLTVFSEITRESSYIPLFNLDDEKNMLIDQQLKDFNIYKKHNIITENENVLEAALKHFNLSVETMGRGYYDDPSYFLTCSAAGLFGVKKTIGVK